MTPMFRKTVPRRAGLCMTPPMSPSPSMRMSINAWQSQKLGYGPDSRLKIKVSVRDLPYLRDPAVIMIDQMKQVYIDGDLERSILRIGFRRSCARITSSASPAPEVGPTPTRISNCFYGCGGELNYNGYCSPEVDKRIDRQSV